MPIHKCATPEELHCRFEWDGRWCGKVVKCPDCGKGINYRLECQPVNCPYFENKRWYKWRGWHPFLYKGEYLKPKE
jgi:hypothetical protein